MQFCVLGSGSRGNATLVVSGATRVLIDAGFSGIEVKRRLAAMGLSFDALAAILVTHEHVDHIRGVPVLSRQGGLAVYANAPTVAAAAGGLGKLHRLVEFETGTGFEIGDLLVHPFAVSHDAADPVGFLISDGHFSLGYCTDTGAVSRLMGHRLRNCHGLVLEANHDLDMLNNGSYPPALKQRVRSNRGHLGNHQTADFLRQLHHAGLRRVVLAHLSGDNNRPDLARVAAAAALEEAAAGGPGPDLLVACQDRPGPLLCLASGS